MQAAAEVRSAHEVNLLRMNTSVKLNAIVREHSKDAQLVLMNCPGVPDDASDGYNYMCFLEVFLSIH